MNYCDQQSILTLKIFNFVSERLSSYALASTTDDKGFNRFVYEYYNVSLLIRFDVMEFSVAIYYEIWGHQELESYFNLINKNARCIVGSIPTLLNDANNIASCMIHYKNIFDDLELLYDDSANESLKCDRETK